MESPPRAALKTKQNHILIKTMHFLSAITFLLIIATLLVVPMAVAVDGAAAPRHRRQWLSAARGAGGDSGNFWSLLGRRRR
uniref:Uncharacterized protein n=1 Tax=Globodera pallida TaxID=36090 RepID=A0A183BM43_GLOPA